MGNKLELTRYGKEKEIKVEPRILIEDKNLSYSKHPEGLIDDGIYDNMLIHGDNLLALKALEQDYTGKIKCIYIDPPYNTGNAFNVYDDNIEHSIWLSLIRDRLILLRKLLADDGVFYVQINDDEAAYLKVLCDEIFGRDNYETTLYIKVRHENRILRQDTRWQLVIEQVLVYRKTSKYIPPRRKEQKNGNLDYKRNINITGFPKAKIKIGTYEVELYPPTEYELKKVNDGEGKFKQYQIRGSLITQKGSASEYYELNLRNRREEDGLGMLYKVIGLGINGDGLGYRYIMQPEKKNSKNGFYFQGKPLKKSNDKGLPFANFYDETIPFNNSGYEGKGYFNGGKKPEEWIKFLLSLVHFNKGDYVLDSFLGSGTTAAVCTKLGLNYIGIELGEHAYTLCKPRLDSILNGEDQHGIAYEYKKVTGYKFFELAPTLIKKDSFGEEIINPEYNAEMLAAAIAKHEGYSYNPDKDCYWKQAKSENNSYLYVTTKHVNRAMIEAIKEEMNDDDFLLIVCKSFDEHCNDDYSKSISIKKIPQSLLKNCEFGVDNYNLNIICPPEYEEDEEDE